MKLNKCPSCGANVKHDSLVCEYCGNSFTIEEEPTKNKDSQQNTQLEPEVENQTISQEVKQYGNSLAKTFKQVSWLVVGLCWVFVWPLGFILLIGKLVTTHNANKM